MNFVLVDRPSKVPQLRSDENFKDEDVLVDVAVVMVSLCVDTLRLAPSVIYSAAHRSMYNSLEHWQRRLRSCWIVLTTEM